MQHAFRTTAIAALFALGTGLAAAAPVGGGTSNSVNVAPAASAFPFDAGHAGLVFNNQSSLQIDLAGGPIHYADEAIARGADGSGNYYLRGEDIGFLPGLLFGDIAQVWRNDVAYNGDTTTIHSFRQLITPSGILAGLVPDFGGLVVGKVEGSPVYFGEWSPKPGGTIPHASTDLNMGSAQRTVWYVGENPTTSMPTLVNAQYNVVGINQHDPANPSVYQGVLTANYGSGSGYLNGSITRGSDAVDFGTNATAITSTGAFSKGTEISGHFYGSQAEALAGIYTGATPQDHVAFGGARQ